MLPSLDIDVKLMLTLWKEVGSVLSSSVSWKIVYELIVDSLNTRIIQQNAWSWNFSFKRFTYLPILISVRLIILSVLNFGSILRH